MTEADLTAQAAAACLNPDLFTPVIRKAADDFYERLLDSVQDYLVDNARFNIASRISAAEREAQSARDEASRYKRALYSISSLTRQDHHVTDSTIRKLETRCLSAYDVGKIVEEALFPASADTRPEGGDSTQIEAPFTSGAVPHGDEADAQTAHPIQPRERK